MLQRVADDATFSNFAFSNLKLGFDQSNDPCRLPMNSSRQEQHFQGDKGYIDGHKINWFRQQVQWHVPDVHPFDWNHAAILSELPGQLAVTDIHRIYTHGAVLKQTIRKTARGSADIQTTMPCTDN